MNKEIWKDIKGYEGYYQISNYGKVKSLGRYYFSGIHNVAKKYQNENIRKEEKTKNGYIRVALCKDGKIKKCLVHRLVAEHFIDNLNSYPQVNHKDENKENNYFKNLEWCDNKYNVNYGKRNERAKKSITTIKGRKVNQYDLKDNFIKQYVSINSASKQFNRKGSNIRACCIGKQKTAYGYKWKYANDELQNLN